MYYRSPRLCFGLAVVLLLVGWIGAGADAGEAEEGRELYIKICSKCHGQITERQVSQWKRNYLVPVITSPLGPNLTGVFDRPAGTYAGYRYSNAFRQVAKDIVWNEENLDRWLTSSQDMIRGSYMFSKVKQPKRRKVIAYLKTYGRYQE